MQIGILEPLDFSQKAKNTLVKYGNVEFFNGKNLKVFLKDKDILFIRLKYKIDKIFLQFAPELKIICTPTTGLNHLNLDEVNKRNIKIISLKGEREFLSTIRATPEHTIGLLISLLRNYNRAFLNTKNSIWNRELYKGYEIYGKTVGIIGMGRVGKILSKYLEAFGADIVYTDIIDIEDAPLNAKKLINNNDLIEQSSIIFLTASYSKDNEKMIDRSAIDLMKDKYFINTARGELLDESYLIKKLSQKHFKGVALDVLSDETNADNKLKDLLLLCDKVNLIITPHIAGATYESMWRTEEFIVEKLLKDIA